MLGAKVPFIKKKTASAAKTVRQILEKCRKYNVDVVVTFKRVNEVTG